MAKNKKKTNPNKAKLTPGGILLRVILIALVVGFVIYPNINIITQVLFEDGAFTATPFLKLMKSKRAIKCVINSFVLGVCLTISVNVVGILSVLITDYWDIKGAKFLRPAYMTSLVYSGVVLASGYLYVYGKNGAITQLLTSFFPGMDPGWFTGFWAVLFMMTFACTSNHVIFLKNAIHGLDYHTIEAAHNMGASDMKILFQIVLPSLLPTIYSLSIMTFLTGLCALSGPAMVGGEFQTINPMIVSFANSPGSRDLAAVLAMVLGLATIFLIVILNKLESKGNFISVSKTKAKMRKQKLRNPVADVIAHIVAYAMFIIYMLPICFVIIFSFQESMAVKTSKFSFSTFTIEHYITLFTKPNALSPFLVSLVYSVVAALLAAAICVLAARLVVKKDRKFDKVFEYGMLIPWMLPTTFVALGILFTFNEPRWFVGNAILVGSVFAMLIAYVVIKLPFSFRMIRAALMGIDNNMEEAALTMGAKGTRILLQVILPVILPSVMSVAALNFNALLGDYDLSVFLYSPRFQPLGVVIKFYSDEGAAINGQAMTLVYSVMLMILCTVALYFTQGDGVKNVKKLLAKKAK